MSGLPERLLFLPGASGDTAYWRPLERGLACRAERLHLGWPGFGDTPPRPGVNGFDDLLALVLEPLDRPCALVAQSMGGVLALRAALARPRWVTHLVLCATSGGLPMAELGAADWRASFRTSLSHLPDWFATATTDLSGRLPEIAAPTLLLWGDADPFSPVAVGECLAQRLPRARLEVINGGDHDLGLLHAGRLAPLVEAHLSRTPRASAVPLAPP